MGTGATVFGGLILRYFDLLDDALAWLLNTATYSIAVPAGLLALLVAALVRLAWPHFRRHYRRWRGVSGIGQLDNLQVRMLAVYRLLSQHWMYLSFFEESFDRESFRVQQALDGLVDLGYLEIDDGGDPEYRLTPAGRDVSLEIDMEKCGYVEKRPTDNDGGD